MKAYRHWDLLILHSYPSPAPWLVRNQTLAHVRKKMENYSLRKLSRPRRKGLHCPSHRTILPSLHPSHNQIPWAHILGVDMCLPSRQEATGRRYKMQRLPTAPPMSEEKPLKRRLHHSFGDQAVTTSALSLVLASVYFTECWVVCANEACQGIRFHWGILPFPLPSTAVYFFAPHFWITVAVSCLLYFNAFPQYPAFPGVQHLVFLF